MVKPGQSSYAGTTRNGVTTRAYGSWGGSYVIVGATPGTASALAGSGWNVDSRGLRASIGQRFKYGCPAGGTPRVVWGSGTYTDDSSICTAAVHAGRISFARGGTVTILVKPGQSSYAGTTRNGVTTRAYGSWGGSYVIVGATPGTASALAGSGWNVDSRGLRASIGQRFKYGCPAGGTPRVVWGSGTYTDDSSICTAAVHAGRISFARGGTVTILVKPGQSSYTGTTRNGVTTRAYGSWGGSYVIVGATPG